MTGLAKRGHPVRTVRTGIELAALALRAALGGTVGVGTVVFAPAVGPNVHFFLTRMTLPPPRPPPPTPTYDVPGHPEAPEAPPPPPPPTPGGGHPAVVHGPTPDARR